MFKRTKYVTFKAEDIINDGHYFNSNLLLLEILKAYDKTNENQYIDEALRLTKRCLNILKLKEKGIF